MMLLNLTDPSLRKRLIRSLLALLLASLGPRHPKQPPPLVSALQVQSGQEPLLPRQALSNRSSLEESLPVLTKSFNPDVPDQLGACEDIFHRPDQMQGRVTVAEFGLMTMIAKMHSKVYNDIFLHHYDSPLELKLAAGPEVDQERCLSHLRELIKRAELSLAEGYRSRDVNLYQLLDTFGKYSSGIFVGRSFFEGMYHECKRLRIRMGPDESLGTRYCLAKLKHLDWPQVDRFDLAHLKAAVCLPESCDSLDYKDKFQLIHKLLFLQTTLAESNATRFTGLYCLPDEASPLRSVGRSTATWLTLLALALWLLLLLAATYKDHLSAAGCCVELDSKSAFGLSKGLGVGSRREAGGRFLRLVRILSITNNLRLLFDTSKRSALMMSYSARSEPTGAGRARSGADETASDRGDRKLAGPRELVDLRCIEGVKVISMCYVIMGHVLMCSTSLVVNGREMSANNFMAFIVANLVPAFAVNSFFAITGILTSYLLFRQGEAGSLASRPARWLALAAYRYLRIMPMYALVVLYAKHLARFAGSGPLWDYGTSVLGQRRACSLEPWSTTWLFAANFLPALDHCIPSAWYLANDFQFFLITPILLAPLHRWPRLGRRLLAGGALAGLLAGFYSIFSSPVDDLRPIATFAPHGFKTYVSHFSANYSQPQYRIPAYLVGLLIGHNLYTYERDRLHRSERQADEKRPEGGAVEGEPEEENPADCSDSFKRLAVPISPFLILACCLTPVIGSRLPFSKPAARLMVALITPSYHILFALAVGLFIRLATTGQANSWLTAFLAAPHWKPLARLSLSTVLINVEVINYIIQSNTSLYYFNNLYLVSLNLVCILATYLVSLVVCLLFEAPLRGALNELLAICMSKRAD